MDDDLLYDRWYQLRYCLEKRGEMSPETAKSNTITPIITQPPIKQILFKGNKGNQRKSKK